MKNEEVILNLLDAPQWGRLYDTANDTEAITEAGTYPMFNETGGPNELTSMEVANQFSATSDLRAFSIQLVLVPAAANLTSAADFNAELHTLLTRSYISLDLNRQNSFNIALHTFGQLPAVVANATNDVSGGPIASLVLKHKFGSKAPLDFPGGQTFKMSMIFNPASALNNGIKVFYSLPDSYQLLRDRAQQV